MPTLRLPLAQANDIAAICSFGNELLAKIASRIERMPRTIDRDKIQAELDEFGEEVAAPLGRVLFALAAATRRRFGDVSSLLDQIRPPISWEESHRKQWQEAIQKSRPALERLLSAESVVLATKALDLSYDVERFCVTSRIITDIRPVFDADHTQIIGSTIRHTLRLEYMGVEGSVSSMSIGLDADDIARIKSSCEEATKKATAVRELLTKSGIKDVIIPGEET